MFIGLEYIRVICLGAQQIATGFLKRITVTMLAISCLCQWIVPKDCWQLKDNKSTL